jgi:hypothetical protein
MQVRKIALIVVMYKRTYTESRGFVNLQADKSYSAAQTGSFGMFLWHTAYSAFI